MQSKNLYCVLLLVVLLFPIKDFGQSYPVQVSPQLIPPYSLKLSDFSTSMSDRIILTILSKDITDVNRSIFLKFSLNGQLGLIKSTDIIVGATPLTIDGGIPLRLSNLDLRPYFEFENLRGISAKNYSSPLPDGLYQFCFEVYDTQTGLQISNKGCATVFLTLNDPPILNSPANNVEILEQDVQNIIFQWTPRHLNASNVEYEFSMVEIWDDFVDPQAAFLNSVPLYSTTTSMTTIIYGPGETYLLPDKKYAWRVRAKVSDGISENSVFRNNGYSEIHSFVHVGKCNAPLFLLGASKGKTTERITWQGQNHNYYKVQFKKKNAQHNDWFTIETVEQYALLENLEENTTYEYKVGGQCRLNGDFSFSDVYEFTTTAVQEDDEVVYNCGISPKIVIESADPLERLKVDDQFTVGDFKVTVKELSASQGNFSGAGFVKVPYLKTKLKVTFEGIKINKEYQLYEGAVMTNFNAEDSLIYDVQEGIDKIKELTGNLLDKLDAIVNEIKGGQLKAKDLDELLDHLKDELSTESLKELQEIQNQIAEQEELLEQTTDPGTKEAINHKINELNDQFAAKVEVIKTEISDLIVKAIETFYLQQKENESSIINNFKSIFSFKETPNPESIINEMELELEEELIGQELSNDMESALAAQDNYYLFMSLKAMTVNKENHSIIKTFVDKALDSQIDLIKIMNDAKSQGESDTQIKDRLIQEIRKVINQLIDTNKYNYLD